MTRYELKDSGRQAALEKALPGFEEALQSYCKDQFSDPTDFVNVAIGNGKGWGYECLVGIQKNAILVKETYDPKKWNKYPEVTPPEGVWMRCEGETANGRIIRDAAIFLRGKWRWWEVGPDAGMLVTFDIKRFRPWDEEGTK